MDEPGRLQTASSIARPVFAGVGLVQSPCCCVPEVKRAGASAPARSYNRPTKLKLERDSNVHKRHVVAGAELSPAKYCRRKCPTGTSLNADGGSGIVVGAI